MSDLVDRYEASSAAVAGAGAVFVNRCRGAALPPPAPLPRCSCGGRAAYAHYPMRLQGHQMETLGCACGNRVGPLAGRQALAEAWRLGGWAAKQLIANS